MVRLFGHYVPRTLLLLLILEAMALFSSVYLAVMLRFWGSMEVSGHTGPIWLNSVIMTFVMITMMTITGLYFHLIRDGVWGILYRLLTSFLIGFFILSSIYYVFPAITLGRGILGLSFIISIAGIVTIRLLFHSFSDHEALKRRILVLGAGKKANIIGRLMRRKVDKLCFNIVGYVPVPKEKTVVRGKIIDSQAGSLLEIAKKYQADDILVAPDERRNTIPMGDLIACRMAGLEVIDLSSFFERQARKIMLDQLNPSWLAYGMGFHFGALKAMLKRIFDIIVSLVFLLITWPLMLLTAIAIKIESKEKGSVLYRQVRVGQYAKQFEILKFRSMAQDAEQDGVARWASLNDSRITRVGKIIRKSRLDELPQLINVLRGDMSFVGPRPERPEFVKELAGYIPYFEERHRVKPGITGWAQICYPYGASKKDALEKLQYDLYYIKNYTVFLDLMIVFQTAQAILWGKGAR